MRSVVAILKARWFVTLLGVLFLSLVIWLVGPLLGLADSRPLESPLVRLVVILVLLLVWALALMISLLRARSSNQKMIAELATPAAAEADDSSGVSDEELAVLQERLQEALSTLKRAKFAGAEGRQFLYQLPWYILIGPPGSGKTTALVNSGLDFPLAGKFGKDAVKGVGGTRNCDWWFTNEAVMIDTAGRYTTQDSHKAVDAAVWSGFLDLLKKHRPRQPVNGALIAISLADLAGMSEPERTAHARTIKQRIQELHERLGVRFPIYVLFTKADLIAGFNEFYEDLGRAEREQVWGFTFPIESDRETDGPLPLFDAEFDALVDRLNGRLLERVHQEPDVERRGLVYGFPLQVASLKDVAREFLAEIFRPSRYEVRPMWRGVYLTSGTQEGTPIDRIMGALAASFGLDRQRLKSQSGTGRSYFITRLLKDVVFREANIVGSNRRVERRRVMMQRAALAAGIVLTLAMAGAWFYSYAANRDLIARVGEGIDDFEGKLAPLTDEVVTGPDFAKVLPPLDALRSIPTGYQWRDYPVPVQVRLGLYQGWKIGDLAEGAYERALNSLLLPHLMLRLEEQISDQSRPTEFVYQALKVYLMLGGQGQLDAGFVRQWFELDWGDVLYPGPANAGIRETLLAHLGALLATRLEGYPLDPQLVDDARTRLAAFPLPERAYRIIKDEVAGFDLPDWRVVDHGGPAVAQVFVRASGQPLSEGVDGLFTYTGFYEVFLPLVDEVAQQVAEESWVLGPQGSISLDDTGIELLKANVTDLYYADFVTAWEGMLGDLRIVPFQDLSHAVRVLNFLATVSSPMRELLLAVSKETTLAVPPPEEAEEAVGEAAGQVLAEQAQRQLAQRSRLLDRIRQIAQQNAGPEAAVQEMPGQEVDDRFDPLQFLVQGEGGTAPLDPVIGLINEAYQELSRVENSLNSGSIALGIAREGGAAQRLAMEATRLPQPVSGWIQQIADGISGITIGGAQSGLNAVYQAEVLPVCRQSLEGRYPIYGGANDIPISDFTRLFAPGGVLDKFFNEQLRTFVDTSTPEWTSQRLEISQASLAQFQRATVIRDAFFPTGGSPQVQFELTPVALDATASQVLLEIGGEIINYAHGPPQPKQLTWPDPSGINQARISFSPPIPGQPSSITKDGPWAFFRLLDEAWVGASSRDRLTVTFTVGARSATFDLRAGSVVNPFTMPELEAFRCPTSL